MILYNKVGNIFSEITLIVVSAALFSLLFKILKQPAILAYILTGIVIGPFGGLQFQNFEVLRTLGTFGITFLLFMVGLELRFSDLKSVGKTSLIAGASQIVLTFILGFFLSKNFGFSQIESLYIAIALTFSSTVIAVKLLSDNKNLNSLYGKIAVGILLIQDFFAVLILILLSGFTNERQTFFDLLTITLKGVSIFGLVLYLSKTILPKLVDLISRSSETLFLFSIAFALVMSGTMSMVGFSPEIGGLLAGLALSNSSEHFQIIARTKSLRDFFVTIFFVVLGMSMTFKGAAIFQTTILLSVFVLLVKTLIVMSIIGFLGYKKRTSFLTAISLSQISEFSLIIVFLGGRLGHISTDVVSLITAVAVITFITSTYMVTYQNKLYDLFKKYFAIFERKQTFEEQKLVDKKDHVILIGVNRVGVSVLDALLSAGEQVVAIDFNPDVIKKLRERKSPSAGSGQVTSLFGDISDSEIAERAALPVAKLVISTIPDIDDNIELISQVSAKGRSSFGRRPKVVVVAEDDREEEELYKAGADYVIQPHVLGGKHLAHLIKTNSLAKI